MYRKGDRIMFPMGDWMWAPVISAKGHQAKVEPTGYEMGACRLYNRCADINCNAKEYRK